MDAAEPVMPAPGVDPFALLDDRDATAARPTSRLYTGFVREVRCTDPHALETQWAAVATAQANGLHAVLLGDYEWGAKLLGAGTAVLAEDDGSALRVLLFAHCERLSRAQVDAWLEAQEGQSLPGATALLDRRESVTEAAFTEAIHAIHEAIRAGETYQVNYTYRVDFRLTGEPLALYRRLRARQPVPYGALIALPTDTGTQAMRDDAGQRWVLSCSPELFVRHHAGVIAAKPMKGTASRALAPESDSESARLLNIDIKNRAENLMIVDLLRNDLGRVARIGSVKVPELFAVESHATVFQMTSTVEAELLPSIDPPALLRAIFPCGSITGAPKHHTMDLIARFESTRRGLYTGAIGWIDAPVEGRLCGDLCLSVAIRTLVLGPPAADGARAGRLGIGAGIVLDSVAADEFEECRLKGRFLTALDPGFELFETLAATREGGIPLLDRHLARLRDSARTLGFRFDDSQACALLNQRLTQLPPATAMRLRLALAHDGRLSLTHAVLDALPTGTPVQLRLEARPLPRPGPLARHKTTLRAAYDAGVAAAQAEGAFDSLFFDAHGVLVEGGRSNVLLKLHGNWVTPPLDDGALPGVMRSVLLDDPRWALAERHVTREDLQHAEAIVVCNALRGAVPATLRPGSL
jgi:para-aminobenzoate synthetase/4-amino-4-deoxychorismate lyase